MEKETVEIIVSYEEYKKIKKYFPYSFWNRFLITVAIIFSILLIGLLPPEPVSFLEVLESTIFFSICAFIVLKIIELLTRKYNYKKMIRKEKNNIRYNLYFYDGYFEKKSESLTEKIEYQSIWKIRDFDNCIYILLDKKKIIPIRKEKCSLELKKFIKELKLTNGSNKIEDIDDFFTPAEKYSGMRKFLIFLFILTLFSLLLGLVAILVLTNLNVPSSVIEYFPSMRISFSIFYINVSSALMLEYLWGFLLCLPIPILSIALGFIYRRKGLKCTKNIVAGFIFGIIIAVFSCVSFMSDYNFEKDYSETALYQELVSVPLPKEGRLFKMDSATGSLLSLNYVLFEDKEENEAFYNNIMSSDKWLSKEEISTELSYFMPLVCESEKQECYYSIYFDKNNSYNMIPKEEGEYHVYTMLYDPDLTSLKINKYLYIHEVNTDE